MASDPTVLTDIDLLYALRYLLEVTHAINELFIVAVSLAKLCDVLQVSGPHNLISCESLCRACHSDDGYWDGQLHFYQKFYAALLNCFDWYTQGCGSILS